MRKSYFVVKLAPNVSSWCDIKNNIYLSMPNKVSKRLKEGCDMKMIKRGVKAKLLLLEEHFEEIEEEVVQEAPVEPVKTAEPVEVVEPAEVVEKEIPEVVKEFKKARSKRKKEEVQVEVNIVKDEEDKE